MLKFSCLTIPSCQAMIIPKPKPQIAPSISKHMLYCRALEFRWFKLVDRFLDRIINGSQTILLGDPNLMLRILHYFPATGIREQRIEAPPKLFLNHKIPIHQEYRTVLRPIRNKGASVCPLIKIIDLPVGKHCIRVARAVFKQEKSLLVRFE